MKILIWRVPNECKIPGALSPVVNSWTERIYVAIPSDKTLEGFSKCINKDGFEVPEGFDLYVKVLFLGQTLSDVEIQNGVT